MAVNTDRKEYTIILISADTEWRAVKNIFPNAGIQKSPLGEWFPVRIEDRKIEVEFEGTEPAIIFFHGGWGKIAAAASTQYVIDRWQPKLIVNLGTCGGFEGYITRGAIILVEKTIVYDIIEQMGDYQAHIDHYSTDIDLSWLVPPYPQDVLCTTLVSGDRDLLVDDLPELRQRYGAIAGDWESGAIAYVTARNRTRTLILRGVTDLVGSGGGEAYGDLGLFEKAATAILNQLITALPDWLAAEQNK